MRCCVWRARSKSGTCTRASLTRRHEPDAPLRTLRAFLDAWSPNVRVVTSTPQDSAATAALRDTYLLRIMSDMWEGVAGYACSADDKLDTDTQLMYVLYWMDVLDHLWAARLGGRHVALDEVQQRADSLYPTPDHASRIDSVLEEVVTDDRVLGAPVDMPQYSPTDRVRLRDEMTRAREQLFGWMRDQLRLPRPPTIEEVPTAVPTDDEAPATWEPDEAPVSESDHYARLFSQRLDPDEEPPAKRSRMEDHAFWDTHYASLFSRSLLTLRPTP